METTKPTSANNESFREGYCFPLAGLLLALCGLKERLFGKRKPRLNIDRSKFLNPTGEELTPEKLITFKGLTHLTREQAEKATESIKNLARFIYHTVNKQIAR